MFTIDIGWLCTRLEDVSAKTWQVDHGYHLVKFGVLVKAHGIQLYCTAGQQHGETMAAMV